MLVRRASYSLVISVLAVASMGGDCTLGPGRPPVRECFTDLGNHARIQVVLGSPTDFRMYGGAFPSCGGVDGLLPGATVVLRLVKTTDSCHDNCVGYHATSVDGLAGVTVLGTGQGGCGAFASVGVTAGSFVGDVAPPSCHGSWEMELRPKVTPDWDMPISPFDAGHAQAWIMWRRMGATAPSSTCGTGGTRWCEDAFVVQGIANATP